MEAYEITLLSVYPSLMFFLFFAVRVVSKESRRLVLPRTYCTVVIERLRSNEQYPWHCY
jgi:hypothetical protein